MTNNSTYDPEFMERVSRATGISVLRIGEELLCDRLITPCQATTIEEAEKACRNAPMGHKGPAYRRWCELSARDVERAATIEEAEKAFFNAPESCKVYAHMKWVSLCTTVEEIRKACCNAPMGHEVPAYLKWHKLSARDVERAATVEELVKAYHNAPGGSEEERTAILRIVELFALKETQAAS